MIIIIDYSDDISIIFKIHDIYIGVLFHFHLLIISDVIGRPKRISVLHVPKLRKLLTFILAFIIYIIARGNVNYFIHTGVEVKKIVFFLHFLSELIQKSWVYAKIDCMLTIDPMSEQMVEIWK